MAKSKNRDTGEEYRLRIEWTGRGALVTRPYPKVDVMTALKDLHTAMAGCRPSASLTNLGLVVSTSSILCASAVEPALKEGD